MERLIRSYLLSTLSNIPLTSELQNLHDAILFIENIIDTAIITNPNIKRNNLYEYYFIEDKVFFEKSIGSEIFWCRKEDFVNVLKKKYNFPLDNACLLIEYVYFERFKVRSEMFEMSTTEKDHIESENTLGFLNNLNLHENTD